MKEDRTFIFSKTHTNMIVCKPCFQLWVRYTGRWSLPFGEDTYERVNKSENDRGAEEP